MNYPIEEFFQFLKGDPLIIGATVSIALGGLAVVLGLTYFKKWRWLYENWLTTVDHKKIGIMYIIFALVMLFRGGIDALMMRAQTAIPENGFISAQHYNEVFTTHGLIMILFMAMPFVIGLINIAVPLQIGARDVAFPYLNAVSFWLMVAGGILLNISFIIGGSPDSGWTSYFPLATQTETVGSVYYMMSLFISGIGTTITGVNFIVTILKMRAPGMTLMKMPMFTWSILITMIIVLFAFPPLTIAILMGSFDLLFGSNFFTTQNGGMDMLWANLFWIWGHPEVYIVILPAFGIFSEVITAFSKKNLFGYKSMVASMVAISILSFTVWVHHFYTMGQGALSNSFFSITTMLIAVPTGVKIFNWLATLYKGKIEFTTPMLYTLGFIPIFTLGGVTGVMLAMASADYQYHNTMFLVAHFHYVLIPGTVFAVLAGFYYWWPLLFGFKLNEKLGKIAFWIIAVSFNVTFFPMFILGLDGMTRRMSTYSEATGYGPLNMLSFVGALGLAIGFAVLVYGIYWSIRHEPRGIKADPWDARGLEWSTSMPVPAYNFARVPQVSSLESFWNYKQGKEEIFKGEIEEIHMPSNSGVPLLMGIAFTLWGFCVVFSWWIPAIILAIPIFWTLFYRSFNYDKGYHIHVNEIEETESKLNHLRGEKI